MCKGLQKENQQTRIDERIEIKLTLDSHDFIFPEGTAHTVLLRGQS